MQNETRNDSDPFGDPFGADGGLLVSGLRKSRRWRNGGQASLATNETMWRDAA